MRTSAILVAITMAACEPGHVERPADYITTETSDHGNIRISSWVTDGLSPHDVPLWAMSIYARDLCSELHKISEQEVCHRSLDGLKIVWTNDVLEHGGSLVAGLAYRNARVIYARSFQCEGSEECLPRWAANRELVKHEMVHFVLWANGLDSSNDSVEDLTGR